MNSSLFIIERLPYKYPVLSSVRAWLNVAMIFCNEVLSNEYRNDPKFSDKYAWANSADPDQTAPRGAV